MARLLLERGADPNAKNRFGEVPLNICVQQQQDRAELIKLLLEFGVMESVNLFIFLVNLLNLKPGRSHQLAISFEINLRSVL